MTLSELLMELASIGAPRLSRGETGGWHASVKFPAPEGTTAEVRSNFDHHSPEEALQCVHDRLGGLRDMLAVPSPMIGAPSRTVEQ